MNAILTALFFCQADCAAINIDAKWLQPLGSIEATSEVSKLEAFQLMKRDCKKLARAHGGTAILVKDFSFRQKNENYNSSEGSSTGNWGPASAPRGQRVSYSWSIASTFRSEYYVSDDFRLEVDFARVLDKDVCGRLEKNPKGRPRYTGSEEPFGS